MYLLFVSLEIVLFIFALLFSLFVLAVLTFRFVIEPIKKGRCTCKTDLTGKVVIITGGNSGIGLETARDLSRRNAKVIIASRDTKKSEEAVKSIKETSGNDNVEYKYLDLSKFSSIREFVSDFNKNNKRLDILVNNSGVGGLKNKLTEDGINNLMQINYVGQFLLTNLLLDKLKESAPSRIVIVSSYLHKWAKLDPNNIAGRNLKASLNLYNISKLCGVLWTKALAKRLPKEVVVNALHPGVVKTPIFKKIPGWRQKLLYFVISLLFKTPEEGAQTIIHLSVSPNIKTSGDYYVDCEKSKPAEEAFDDELVEKVYRETMNLIKI
ncbi:retinol dehydrogenase 12-like [Aricia agestis]|uniref:retinol dehydrogenase 12-like n=1 Tax=Aricia agestis TaxID=91739 RepID=UPI001C207F63|nr:retinol dehydrogenase 12-like [Aricia agestis]